MEEPNELILLKQEVTLLRKERASLRGKITRLTAENKELAQMLEITLDKNTELEKNLLKIPEENLENDLLSFIDNLSTSNKTSSGKKNKQVPKQGSKSHNFTSKEKNTRSSSVVYFVNCEAAKAIKIGISRDVRSRLSSIQTGNPFKLSLIGCVPGTITEERILHEYFSEIRAVGEWFYTNDRLIRYTTDVTTQGKFIDPFEWFKPNLCHLKTEPHVLKLIKRRKTSFEQSQEIITQAEAYISALLPASAST